MIDDPKKFMEDYNRRAHLANFPPDKMVDVQSILFQPGPTPEQSLLSIGVLDHNGAESVFCMKLPDAMYLLYLLAQLQRQTGAAVPDQPPSDNLKKN